MLLIVLLTTFLACKNDAKKVEGDAIYNDSINASTPSFKDKEIEKALYNGTFVKNSEGFDVAVLDNTIYLFNKNPTEEEKKNHFFLEITKNNSTLPTKDLLPEDLYFSDSLSNNFSDVAVYKYVLKEPEGPLNLLIGQFDSDKRIWYTFIHADKINSIDIDYKNEYLKNIKTNVYLNNFESAFDEGYFMKSLSDFDLLLNENTLYYIKPNGTISDLNERFFLHITYEDNERKIIDFKPSDFQIDNLLGNKYSNFIILKKEIPDNGKITELGTGQYDKTGQKWSIVYEIVKLYDDMNFIYDDQYKDILK